MTGVEPQPGTGHCHLCDTDVPTYDLLGHIRVMHPDEYGDGPERWPDGGYVVYDAEPDPDDAREQPVAAWKPRRFFWWNTRTLTYRWRPLYLGGTDEFGNRTLGIRLPGGVLFACLNVPLRTEEVPDP